jgi:CRP-like cAMP-binding protein
MLFVEGDRAEQVSVVIEGCVKIMQLGPDGEEVILHVAGRGEVVGVFSPLLHRKQHVCSAQALRTCIVLSWTAAGFESLMETFPSLRKNVTLMLEQRLNELERRFRELSTEKVSVRLANALVRLSRQIGQVVGQRVEIRLSHEEVAKMIGTTLFTVSRILSEWEASGIVALARERVVVVNPRALADVIGANQQDTSKCFYA